MTRFLGFMTLVLVLLIVGVMAGCTGAQAVPGATTFFTYTAPNGVKVSFQSDKDSTADLVSFDPATGQLRIEKMNSKGSAIADQQAAFMTQQSNNMTTLVKALLDSILSKVPS